MIIANLLSDMASADTRDLSGDKGVVATTAAKTDGDRAADLNTVVVNYWVRRPQQSAVGDASPSHEVASRDRFEFVVDSGTEGCAGLDWAVKDMRQGDRCTFRMTTQYLPPTEGADDDLSGWLEVEV